ncbi:sensor histidine kinase [Armatimonas rosea]|uniref:histidine kinase n=1 Tax=Armatimonas rosea TaxID=685828 RepID=A0A7W9W6I5_ARMRO|nr:GAF domain-containing sensor histidine kinase [Armatimonas rosea]MBB6050628.1 signal transduction histidine kinase [Armatimonas rosea]
MESVTQGVLTPQEMQAQLEHRERQIEAIRRTSDALFSHPSVDTMVQATLKIALEVLRADSGTVYLYDSQNDTLVFRYVIGPIADQLMGKSIPASQGVAGTVFRTGTPVLIGDVSKREDFNANVDKQTGYQTQSMMTVPVKRTGGSPIGVMQVMNPTVPFTQHDLEVLEVLCAQAATGIEHAQLLEAQRNAEIGNRVGEISHDIKNMMTPIETGVMTLQPMLDDLFQQVASITSKCPEGETWGAEVADAVGGVEGLYSWLLDDLLTAAKRVRRRTQYIAGMVKGTLPPPVFEEGCLNDVVNDVVKTLKRTATDKGISLKTDLDRALPHTPFDYDRFYDCLYNLVNNALPETPAGGTVTVRTRSPKSPGGNLLIEVQDTGRGIPEEIRKKLFTNQAVSTKVGGTGLGTSVSARVAREHGGSISVESTVGVGSTFIISVPPVPPVPESPG